MDWSLEMFVDSVQFAGMDNEQVRQLSGMTFGQERRTDKVMQENLDFVIKLVKSGRLLLGCTDLMEDSVEMFAERLGWPAIPYVGHANSSSREDIPDLATARRILAKNQYDAELYHLAREELQRL